MGWNVQAQTMTTTLSPGDLAFTGYQADTPDEFSFVLLTDVVSGTEISFTDHGWFSTGGFRTNEGVKTLTFTADYSCGTEVHYNSDGFFIGTSPVSAGTLSSSGSFALSGSGDQLFAFQGTEAAPSLIAGIQMNGAWDGEATNSNTSAEPIVLAGMTLAISPEVDNAVYNCEITGDTPQDILAALLDPVNWEGDNTVGGYDGLPAGCDFSCGSVMTDACTELFISEYIEGSSFNKCIEIYNPTMSTVDLAAGGYGLALYSNGAASPSQTMTLSGSIISGGTYVVCNRPGFFDADEYSMDVINFNGDDAFALTKNSENIDVIGQIGVDPGSQWGTGDASTADNTIRRNMSITSGDPDGSDAFDPADEWTGYPQNNADDLGSHVSTCVEPPACMITGLSITNIFGCNHNGTAATNDDFFAFDVVVEYTNAPATGNLVISGDLSNGTDIVVPVADLTGSPFTITGIYNPNFPYVTAGISAADGLPLPLMASFTAEPLCIYNNPDAGPALPPCSVADPCTELFFSEYIEGSGNNKCLEIYNPSDVDVDMGAEGYQIEIYFNGSTSPGSTIPLTGMIEAGSVYVICDDSAMPQFLAAADAISTASFFNGDDAVALVNSGGYTDVIGQIGVDPGSSWNNGGVSTQNSTLVRPFAVTGGEKNGFDAFDPSAGWISLPQDDASDLGIHVSECNPYPPGCDPYTIGDCGGETEYDFDTGIFTLSTNCVSTNFFADAQHAVLKEMCGDGDVTTRVLSITNADWAGIEIRESLAPGSKMVSLKTSLANFIRRDVRMSTDGYRLSQVLFRPNAVWLKLVRSGSQFVGYASMDGNNWQMVMVVNVPMGTCVYAGIYVESTTNTDAAVGMFDNLTVNSSFSSLPLSIDRDLQEARRKGEQVEYPFGLEIPGAATADQVVAVDMNVFPNPATDQVNVVLPTMDNVRGELTIVDMNGKALYRQVYDLDGQQVNLDLQAISLSGGVYQMVLQTDDQVITKRFVKTN